MKRDFRQELTNSIITALESGTAPWQKPWDSSPFERPMNAVSGRAYNGINALYLSLMGNARGLEDPRWCTYRQAEAKGWQVRKGEKGTPIEYWGFTRLVTVTDELGEPVLGPDGKPQREEVRNERPFVRFFFVFNAQQMDGVPALPERARHEWDPVERAERLLEASHATIKHHGFAVLESHGRRFEAYYTRLHDEIHLPRKDRFASRALYYATALHELGHWTGHPSRLDRPVGLAEFGSPEYAKEELRAEIASLFVSAETGIPHEVGHHAAYVAWWIKALKEDKNEVFRAARDANKIAEYVLTFDPERKRCEAEDRPQHEEDAAAIPEPEVIAALGPLRPDEGPRLPAAPVAGLGRPVMAEPAR